MLGAESFWNIAGPLLSVFGLIGLVVAAIVVGFGSRAKALAEQQDMSISSLSAELQAASLRIEAQSSELRDLRDKLKQAQGAIEALQTVVASRDHITALDLKVHRGFKALGVPDTALIS